MPNIIYIYICINVLFYVYKFILSIDAPVCVDASPQVVGAALDEELNVRCAVHADPGEVTFLWQFNNSGESFNVSPARYGEEIL